MLWSLARASLGERRVLWWSLPSPPTPKPTERSRKLTATGYDPDMETDTKPLVGTKGALVGGLAGAVALAGLANVLGYFSQEEAARVAQSIQRLHRLQQAEIAELTRNPDTPVQAIQNANEAQAAELKYLAEELLFGYTGEPLDPDPDPPTLPGEPGWDQGSPFKDGAEYAWLDDAPVTALVDAGAEVVGDSSDPMVWTGAVDPNAGEGSSSMAAAPASASNRTVVYTSARSSYHHEVLPKWGIRTYNVTGAIRNLTMARVGDFQAGREGHAVYINMGDSFLLENFTALQCGGQALQVVFRSNETGLPEAQWPDESDVLTVRNATAIDCGAINYGAAVRASWPFAIYNPGCRVVLEDIRVETDLVPFGPMSTGEYARSHGVLHVGFPDGHPDTVANHQHTPRLTVRGLTARCVDPDRPMVNLEGVDEVSMEGVSLEVPGGVARIAIMDDCPQVRIEVEDYPVRLEFRTLSGHVRETRMLDAGDEWSRGF